MSIAPTPRIVAIVQARMGSTRLPGKVLRNIAGKPLLWHIVHRLRRCRTLNDIVIATSTDIRDNAIEEFCAAENVTCIRGPEDNVLARFALAAEQVNADIILRVSSDAPFLDVAFIDHLITNLVAQDGDYVMLEGDGPCAHEGVDPLSRRALDRLLREVPEDPVAREHVTGYFKLHPEFVRIVRAPADPRFAREGTRLTIDTPDDLAFVEALHERLHAKAGEASLTDLLLLLEREPRLKAINAHVRQKAIAAESGLVLIRCDGGGTLGFGHIKRAVALARAFRDREGFGVLFALNGDESAARVSRDAGFETIILPQFAQANALAVLIGERKPDILLCDARQNLPGNVLARLAGRVPVTALIDDGSDRLLAASHAYFPPVPRVHELGWNMSHCDAHAGWEWAVLGFDPTRYSNPVSSGPSARKRIVVSMGGSDPFDLTRLAALALNKIAMPLTCRFVIGPGFRGAAALIRSIESMNPNFQIVQGVSDLGGEFAAADLALVTFGVTAYELAALGVPALYLALSEDHARSASCFEEAGIGEILGLARAIRPERIAKSLWTLLQDDRRRADMRAAGLNAVDGRGAQRIAADLASALAQNRDLKRARA